jgi:hypothetical protein
MQQRLNNNRIEGESGQLMKTHKAKGQTNQNVISCTSHEWEVLIKCREVGVVKVTLNCL